MKIIGLTGGIASGKSTVAAVLRQLDVPVFDADAVSRQAVEKGSEGLRQIVELFGADYLTASGDLDRAKMAKLVFEDKKALKKLENIVHTYVRSESEKFLQQHSKDGCPAVVLDIPLLIEGGWYKEVDRVWLVSVDEKTQIKRAMTRSGMLQHEVEARIAAQMPLAEKLQYADLIIDNSGSSDDTELFVKNAWRKVLQTED